MRILGIFVDLRIFCAVLRSGAKGGVGEEGERMRSKVPFWRV